MSWPRCFSTAWEGVTWCRLQQQGSTHAPDSPGLGFSDSLLQTWPLRPLLESADQDLLGEVFEKLQVGLNYKHRVIARTLRHIHILYSGSFLSMYLSLYRLRYFTSPFWAANSATDSWDLCCTKESIHCISEMSTAIPHPVQPGEFKMNVQAVPQGFGRWMF